MPLDATSMSVLLMGPNDMTSLLPVPKPNGGRGLISHLELSKYEQHQRVLEEGATQELAFVALHFTLGRRLRTRVCPGRALRAKDKRSTSSLVSRATPRS